MARITITKDSPRWLKIWFGVTVASFPLMFICVFAGDAVPALSGLAPFALVIGAFTFVSMFAVTTAVAIGTAMGKIDPSVMTGTRPGVAGGNRNRPETMPPASSPVADAPLVGLPGGPTRPVFPSTPPPPQTVVAVAPPRPQPPKSAAVAFKIAGAAFGLAVAIIAVGAWALSSSDGVSLSGGPALFAFVSVLAVPVGFVVALVFIVIGFLRLARGSESPTGSDLSTVRYAPLTRRMPRHGKVMMVLFVSGFVGMFILPPVGAVFVVAAIGYAMILVVTGVFRPSRDHATIDEYAQKVTTTDGISARASEPAETLHTGAPAGMLPALGKMSAAAMAGAGAMYVPAMWRIRGRALLGREQEMETWAKYRGGQFASVDAEWLWGDDALPLAAPSEPMWQTRNVVRFSDRDPAVVVGDINALQNPVSSNGNVSRLGLQGTTAVIISTPTVHSLVVTPKRFGEIGIWGNVGPLRKVTLPNGAPGKLWVAATNRGWAQSLLSPRVTETLARMPQPVRLIVDDGRVAVVTVDEWAEPRTIEAMTTLAVRVAEQLKTSA